MDNRADEAPPPLPSAQSTTQAQLVREEVDSTVPPAANGPHSATEPSPPPPLSVEAPSDPAESQHHPVTLAAAAAALLHAGGHVSMRDLASPSAASTFANVVAAASAAASASSDISGLAIPAVSTPYDVCYCSDHDDSSSSDGSSVDSSDEEAGLTDDTAPTDDEDDEGTELNQHSRDDDEDDAYSSDDSEKPEDDQSEVGSRRGSQSHSNAASPLPHLASAMRRLGLAGAAAAATAAHEEDLASPSPPKFKSPPPTRPHTHIIHNNRAREQLGDGPKSLRRPSHRARAPSYSHVFLRPDPKTTPIENHGLIGNLLTAALISSEANVDWLCFPFFDSPPLFYSLIDKDRGGEFRITAGSEVKAHDKGSYCNLASLGNSPQSGMPMHGRPAPGQQHLHRLSTRQMYMHDSNVLLTRFFTDSGVGHVTDWMPIGALAEQRNARSWLVRELECVRGKMYFEIVCKPAFNFGRSSHTIEILPAGALFTEQAPNGLTMLLTSSRNRKWEQVPSAHGSCAVRTKVKLQEGQRVSFVFREWRAEEEKARWTAAQEHKRQLERQKAFLQTQLDKMRDEAAAITAESAAVSPAPSSAPVSPSLRALLSPSQSRGSDWHPPSCTPLKPLHSHIPHHAQRADHLPKCSPDLHMRGDLTKDFGLHTIHPVPVRRTDKLRKRTVEFWRVWLSTCTYTGRWREIVRRSALLLKLMTFEPTGAIVQAATCGLPTVIGTPGEDCRLVCLRDASFTAAAFLKLGFRAEASAWIQWLQLRCDEANIAEDGLQLMYGLRGERDLTPTVVSDVSGYADSGPVHTGSRFARRLSLDMYGAVLIALYLSNKFSDPIAWDMWMHTRKMIEYVVRHWREPTQGMWPDTPASQSTPRHYVVSKLFAWVALDRAISLAQDRSFPAPLSDWKRERNELYDTIQRLGYSATHRRFTQCFDNSNLDVSLLLLGITGFVGPTDPKFMQSLDAIMRSVTDDGLLSHSMFHRFNTCDERGVASDTPQATTSIGTFWAIEACTRGGLADKRHLERARMLMEQMLGFANQLGLYPENIGLRGEFLGAYPHPLTHVALIRAALYLDRALNQKRPAIIKSAMFEAETEQITPHA